MADPIPTKGSASAITGVRVETWALRRRPQCTVQIDDDAGLRLQLSGKAPSSATMTWEPRLDATALEIPWQRITVAHYGGRHGCFASVWRCVVVAASRSHTPPPPPRACGLAVAELYPFSPSKLALECVPTIHRGGSGSPSTRRSPRPVRFDPYSTAVYVHVALGAAPRPQSDLRPHGRDQSARGACRTASAGTVENLADAAADAGPFW